MKATVTPFLRFLQGPKQFFVPIFQRRYSWERKHCEQLWYDVLRLGENDEMESHFLGSIVYMEPGVQNVSVVSELLVIDGQQRLTTISLLLLALSRSIEEHSIEIGISQRRLLNYYLFNADEEDDLRYKQLLTRRDKETLIHLLENRELPANSSPLLVENYHFFKSQLSYDNLETVYTGIQKLRIVDITLDRNIDNPQLIFESLNSTGLSLSQSDLIRNYVLMGQEPDFQNRLYEEYWFPMEQRFGNEYTKRFDRFIRDYLTLKTRQIPNVKSVYEKFKIHIPSTDDSEMLENNIGDISRYAKHYTSIALLQEEDPELQKCFKNIQDLRVEVAFPFLLEVYEDYTRRKIEKAEIIEILRLIESYVFRRAVCGIPTNSLNKTFASLMTEVDKENYLKNLKIAFSKMRSYRRYPSDIEFKQSLLIRDVYNFDRCNYLLRNLENYGRNDPIGDENHTIEHIMPQNTNLSKAWQDELGESFQEIHEKYLHRIGNLTLIATRDNPALSDLPFSEKRDMDGGFRDSPLRLNRSLARTPQWEENAILARAEELAEKALKIWISPQ